MSRIILFLFFIFVWIGLIWPIEFFELIVGVLVSGLVFLVSFRLVRVKSLFNFFKKIGWFILYIPIFLWECFKANIDVAVRVIHPARPLRPGIVKVKTNLSSDVALSFLANSITLTPGTLSVDIDKEKGFLYVHWIDVKDEQVEEATRFIVGRFEKILKRIFE